jgi:DNA-binding NarL/FixJ family response regulator
MTRVMTVEESRGSWLSKWVANDTEIEQVQVEPPDGLHDVDGLCSFILEQIAKERPALLVVAADWRPFPRARRVDQHGVTLLKHLRLTDGLGDLARIHVVLYSFEPVQSLLRRKPGNLILLSPGVTLLRLPDDLAIFQRQDRPFFATRAAKLARLDRDSFYPYVACDYIPTDSAHAISNWWGVRQFHEGRSALRPEEDPPLPLPLAVQSELQRIANKEIVYLFGDERRRPSKPSEQERAELLAIEKDLKDCFRGNDRPRIVLVDDEARLGWDVLFRMTILEHLSDDDAAECLRIVLFNQPIVKVNPEWVHANITRHDPDLVLLDLRLRGNHEADVPVGRASGMEVLQELRKQDCGLPIIMMTASNKYWTYRETLKAGADGYWMKEGLGEHRPPVSAAKHYDDLMAEIHRCLSGGYRDLRRFSRELLDLRQGPRLWWEQMTWASSSDPGKTSNPLNFSSGDRNDVLRQLESALFLFRDYLRLFELKESFVAHHDVQAASEEHLRAIVLAAGKVIEYVHASNDFYRLTGTRLTAKHIGRDGRDPSQPCRGDLVGQRLHAYRSDSAHADDSAPSKEGARDYLALVLAYLRIQPLVYDPMSGREPRNLGDALAQHKAFAASYARIKGGRGEIAGELYRKT